jgi:hypothetical protein
MARRYPHITTVGVKLVDEDLAALARLVEAIPAPAEATRSEAIRRAIRAVPPAAITHPDTAWLVLEVDVMAQLADLAVRFGTTVDNVVIALLNEPNARATVKRELAAMALTS